MKTTAAILDEPTDADDLAAAAPARFDEIELREPTGDEVLVEITAASLCHTDVAIARGHIDEQYPLVMGHEGAGRVEAVGPDVESVAPGDQVVLGRITCGRCEQCRRGNGMLCVKRSEAKANGSLRTGAVRFSDDEGDPVHHCHGVSSFSQYTVVDEEVAVGIDHELPPAQATLLGCGVFTGAGAVMNTADVEAGSSVVVFGAGGVGLSAVQGARLRAATDVICVDVVPEKLSVAEDVGATHTIDASEVDPVETIRDLTGGVDYAFEVVGNAAVAQQSVEVLAPTGQAVLVGVPPAGKHDIALDLYDMVTSEKDILGSFNGSYSLPLAIPTLAELAAAGDLLLEPLVTGERTLSELNEAMEELETGTGIRQVIKP